MSDLPRRTIGLSPRRVLALRGDLLTAVVQSPMPPGSRVGIVLPDGEPPVTGKIVAVRRAPDGSVEIDVRLGSLSRPQRERLADAVSRPA